MDISVVESGLKMAISGKHREHVSLTFYWYLRPLAILFKAFGCFPLSECFQNDGKLLQYKLLSKATAWSAFMFGLCIALLYFTTGYWFQMESKANHIWRVIVAYNILTRAGVNFFIFQYNAKYWKEVIYLLEIYNERKNDIIRDIKPRRKFTWCVLPFVGTVLFSAIMVYNQNGYLRNLIREGEDVEKLFNVNFSILCVWQIFPLCLFLYCVWAVTHGFREICEDIRSMHGSTTVMNVGSKSIITLTGCENYFEELRHLHGILATCVRSLSSSSGFAIAVDNVMVVLMVVINLYVYLFLASSNDLYLLQVTLVSLLGTVVLYSSSENLATSAHSVADVLNDIRRSAVDPACRLEIQTFMQQLIASPVQLSAAGYFTIGRIRLTAILGSVATYLIVVIQYTPYLENLVDGNFTSPQTHVPWT